jgi:succinate dehydrogenase/fumarate reductase flavoprotein subunit
VLGAADDQDPVGVDVQPELPQVPGDGGAIAGAAAVGLVAQQDVQVAGCGEVPQGLAQQVGLAGERGVVEAEINGVRRYRLLVDAVPRRQAEIADGRAPTLLAAHQPHGLELGVDARF